MRVRKRDRHIGKKYGKDAIVFIHSRHSSLKISHGCEIIVREQTTAEFRSVCANEFKCPHRQRGGGRAGQ